VVWQFWGRAAECVLSSHAQDVFFIALKHAADSGGRRGLGLVSAPIFRPELTRTMPVYTE